MQNYLNKNDSLNNKIGGNYRMGEIEDILEQLKKINNIIQKIRKDAKILSARLKMIKGIKIPDVPKSNSLLYVSIIIDRKITKYKKKIFDLLKKEKFRFDAKLSKYSFVANF